MSVWVDEEHQALHSAEHGHFHSSKLVDVEGTIDACISIGSVYDVRRGKSYRY